MKILHLKYKMHKLVNLFFYLIIFGVGFLLGFGVEKIDFNKLISQFLFIDNVSAETVVSCRPSVNLFNKNTVVVGYLTENGSISGEDIYRTSDFIKVSPNTTYYKTRTDSARAKFYDIDKNPLTNSYSDITSQGGPTSFTTPENAYYLRISLVVDYLDTFQIEQGDVGTSYEPYGEEICTDSSDTNNFYEFAQKIFGEVGEENKFIYDFITFGLVVTCFTLFILIVGYIFNKFFGG